MPFPPNDEFGSYEPTITPDGNTIYFARLARQAGTSASSAPRPTSSSRARIARPASGPGPAPTDATDACPDTVNSDSIDQEPADHSGWQDAHIHEPTLGERGYLVTHKQPNGEWTKAQSVGPNVTRNTPTTASCRSASPGDDTSVYLSIRPREVGATPKADLYTTRMEKGCLHLPRGRKASCRLDGLKCRLNGVSRTGCARPSCPVHDFGKFHTMLFVHYDPASKQWKGPIVEAPFNQSCHRWRVSECSRPAVTR